MKNLLNYQSTEFDCGPVSLINAFRYLFDREELPPDLAKYIMLYCNDAYNTKGEIGKHGTSCAAMRFMASFLNDFSIGRNFPVYCKFLGRQDVAFEKGHRINQFIENGGVVILRLHVEVAHYVLVTGIEDNYVLMFDPYYEEYDDPDFDPLYMQEGIEFILDQPKKANRRISFDRLNRITEGYFEMGPIIDREAILIERTCWEPIKQK